MHKWIKRLMVLVALCLVTILSVIYGGFRMFKGMPAWYPLPVFSPAQREMLARRAFNKFADIQNAAALARQEQIASGANQSAPRPAPIVVSFSDDELNAFFEKWENYADWKTNYEKYVDQPIIIIQQNKIVLAGRVKDLDSVFSLELSPRIDADGQLDVGLDRVLAGRLPLPDIFIQNYKDRLSQRLKENLPEWQQHAAIDPDGAANGPLISEKMARLFIHSLDHTSADPVLFLPLVERHANVPVRVTALTVADHTLTMTVLPLNEKEREELKLKN